VYLFSTLKSICDVLLIDCHAIWPLVRIEYLEVSDCSPAPYEVNYLCLYFSQETTILRRVRF
jgi:hypothetical protein